jgi:hypothetical protein
MLISSHLLRRGDGGVTNGGNLELEAGRTMAEKPATKAYVVVRKSWIESGTGIDALFAKPNATPDEQKAAVVVVRATKFNLNDARFAEVEFHPESLQEGRLATVLIPKDQIVTVIRFSDNEDAKKIGFQK